MPKSQSALAVSVESRILFVRNHKVLLDTDLAELYGVPVKQLNQQIKRNKERFPADFVFQLTPSEHATLRSQIVTVLNSERAVEMSVFVVRAFVRLREMLANNHELAAKIDELERRLDTHDSSIQDLIEAIKELMAPDPPTGRRIGFQLPAAKKPS
jgi:hypothetical protein